MLFLETNSNHGDNLVEFVQTARMLDYEVHANFTEGGINLYEVTQFRSDTVMYSGGAVQVAKILGLGKTISVHNHPNGTPFSNTDLLDEISAQPTALIVVTDAQIYTLTARRGWPNEAELRDFIDAAQQPYSLDELTSKWNYNPEKGWLEIFLDDELRMSFLDQFGLEYTVTPTDEWLLSLASEISPRARLREIWPE